MDASNIDERFLPFPKEMNIEHYLMLIKLDNEQMFSVGQWHCMVIIIYKNLGLSDWLKW